MRGRCTKPKMRSAYDQQAKNPTATPTTERTMRFLNSSRWARSGIECASCASRETAASATRNLRPPAIAMDGQIGQMKRGVLSDRWEFITACKVERYNQHCSQPYKSIHR